MPARRRSDFKVIDTRHHGYVMAAEVRNSWLRENFAKCDSDGDGQVTKDEHAICVKQQRIASDVDLVGRDGL